MSTPTDNLKITHTTELVRRQWLSQNAFEIELTRPPSFEFKAGHTILLMHESLERHYSIISTPHDPIIELCLHLVRDGRLSPILADARIGSRFEFTGPHGYFTFKPSSRPPVFVASGTGIAPFVSFARSGVRDFTLLHQAMTVDELYYQNDFIEFTPRYFPCLSEAPVKETSCPDFFSRIPARTCGYYTVLTAAL